MPWMTAEPGGREVFSLAVVASVVKFGEFVVLFFKVTYPPFRQCQQTKYHT